MEHAPAPHDRARGKRGGPGRPRGFTLIEVLLGITILVVGILGVSGMFGTGFTNVAEGGRMTMAVTAARQMLEDVRTIPFDNLMNLNGPACPPTCPGFDTNLPGTLPAANPARGIARKWRYALAGEGTGWIFTTAEKANWQNLGVGSVPFGASGLLVVTSPSATMRQIAITVRVPGRGNTVQLTTLISRL